METRIESPWDPRRLLTLETRMESCQMRGCRADDASVLEGQKDQAVRLVAPVARGDRRAARGGAAGRSSARFRGRVGAQVGRARPTIDDGVRPGTTTEEQRQDPPARAGGPRAAAGERDPEVGVGFLRGGARPPTAVIVDYIDAHRDEFGVEPICTVLSEHGCKSPRRPTTRQDPAAVGAGAPRRGDDADPGGVVGGELRVYGAHKLWKAARRAGHDIGRDQVARLMRELGIEGVRRGEGVAPPGATRPRTGTGSRQAKLHRRGTERVVGHRPDLRADLVGDGLCVFHRRRVQPDDRRLAGRCAHAHRHGPRRARDGPLVPRHPPRRARRPLRCRSQFTSVRYGERLDEIGAHPRSAPSATATTTSSSISGVA